MNYAKINEGRVAKVVAIDESNFQEIEDFFSGQWVKTEDVIGVGFQFQNGVFTPPQPFPSWVLNANNQWEAPVQYPDDKLLYQWDESAKKWARS